MVQPPLTYYFTNNDKKVYQVSGLIVSTDSIFMFKRAQNTQYTKHNIVRDLNVFT